MAPNLASSQHDLIHGMIVDKKFKTRQMADVAEYSERSIKAIRSNLYYLGITKAPPTGSGRPRSITPPMFEALCEYLFEKPGLYREEMVVFEVAAPPLLGVDIYSELEMVSIRLGRVLGGVGRNWVIEGFGVREPAQSATGL
jgi:hypothetical protein